MSPQQTPSARFTPHELQELMALRTRYEHTCDYFSREERARLRFWRWLYHSGRLESVPDSAGLH